MNDKEKEVWDNMIGLKRPNARDPKYYDGLGIFRDRAFQNDLDTYLSRVYLKWTVMEDKLDSIGKLVGSLTYHVSTFKDSIRRILVSSQSMEDDMR